MSREVIYSDQAPAALGPYSQAIKAEGRYVFLAGQVGLDPQTAKLVEGGIEAQAERALQNIEAVLTAAGASLRDVVKTTVLLQSISDFAALNAVYGRFFSENPPARSTFGGLELPAGALVEIECIAVIPD